MTNNMQHPAPTIIDAMGEERQAMEELCLILSQEQNYLIEGAIDQISTVVEEKSRNVMRISELSQRRYAMLQNAGYTPDEAGMKKWLAEDESPEASQMWKALFSVTARTNEVNRVNGMLIGKYLSRNQLALQALNSHHRNAGVYGPDGQTMRNRSRGISV